MTAFSPNLNKITLLRNARRGGGDEPDFSDFARKAMSVDVRSLTVHPPADARHVTLDDMVTLARLPALASGSGELNLNIEGDLRAELISLVETLRPSQFTVVPVTPGEVTRHRGWRALENLAALRASVEIDEVSIGHQITIDALRRCFSSIFKRSDDSI
jgi:pyridoxine 5'-phosphate synthase PdxJ